MTSNLPMTKSWCGNDIWSINAVIRIYWLTLWLWMSTKRQVHKSFGCQYHRFGFSWSPSTHQMFKNISKRLVNENRADHAIRVLAVRRTPRKELFKKWLKDKILNFCSVTSLHGYVHTVNKDYHPFERWIWIILTFIALVTAVVLLWISWNWTAETPTTTVIESTNHPTYNLPFPAVTICGMNKISKLLALETARSM